MSVKIYYTLHYEILDTKWSLQKKKEKYPPILSFFYLHLLLILKNITLKVTIPTTVLGIHLM